MSKEESTTTKEIVSGSTEATKTSGASVSKTKSKQALLTDQVRTQLESYFAPQNIQNDFNLRQKMTSDGYIDIDLLLDLKLISDLATNRDVLIAAIAKSKLLKMNTGCTMVKYMPLLERKVLILRDIATSTKKEEIMTIFDNEQCYKPSEVHSDIGNNWFCSFLSEDECLKTAKYLQQFGTFNNEKLHVRVKAIHDVKKADATPSMTSVSASNKKSKIDTSAPLYSSGFYANYGGYYGGAAAMDPYFGAYGGSKSPDLTKETIVAQKQNEKVVDDRTAISDYPGIFDKYSQETFLKIYSEMKSDALLIPQSMRGRDIRIVCEDMLVPILIASDNEQKDENKKKKKKSKRRKKRKEISGTYYEDDMYDEYGYEYDEYYNYEQDGYYGYNNRRQRRGYYEDNYYNYDDNEYYAQQSPPKQSGNGGRNRAKRGRGRGQKQDGARKYNSRRNGQAKNAKNVSSKSGKVWTQKGVKSDKMTTEKVPSKKPKVLKYSTKKGVYARKAVAAN